MPKAPSSFPDRNSASNHNSTAFSADSGMPERSAPERPRAAREQPHDAPQPAYGMPEGPHDAREQPRCAPEPADMPQRPRAVTEHPGIEPCEVERLRIYSIKQSDLNCESRLLSRENCDSVAELLEIVSEDISVVGLLMKEYDSGSYDESEESMRRAGRLVGRRLERLDELISIMKEWKEAEPAR